jgi:hypothetical protein
VIQRGVERAVARRGLVAVRSSGVRALDALLERRGIPDGLTLVRGAFGSGRTTFALRCVAATHAAGGAAAWIDLARAFDPLEAASRGVQLQGLPIIVPAHARDAIDMAGALLAADAVDLLVLDLSTLRARAVRDDVLDRLASRARRAGAAIVVLGGDETRALADFAMSCRTVSWLRAGGDVVGRTVELALHSGPRTGSVVRWPLYEARDPREDLRIGRIATKEVACAPCTSAGLA